MDHALAANAAGYPRVKLSTLTATTRQRDPSSNQFHLEPLDGVGQDIRVKRRGPVRQSCPECNVYYEGGSLAVHLADTHATQQTRFQCSQCELRLITLDGLQIRTPPSRPGS